MFELNLGAQCKCLTSSLSLFACLCVSMRALCCCASVHSFVPQCCGSKLSHPIWKRNPNEAGLFPLRSWGFFCFCDAFTFIFILSFLYWKNSELPFVKKLKTKFICSLLMNLFPVKHSMTEAQRLRHIKMFEWRMIEYSFFEIILEYDRCWKKMTIIKNGLWQSKKWKFFL